MLKIFHNFAFKFIKYFPRRAHAVSMMYLSIVDKMYLGLVCFILILIYGYAIYRAWRYKIKIKALGTSYQLHSRYNVVHN